MTSSIDPVEFAQQLISCPSITPASGEVFDVLETALRPLGCHALHLSYPLNILRI